MGSPVVDLRMVPKGEKTNIKGKVFYKFIPCWRKPVCLQDVETGELSYHDIDEVVIGG